MDPYHNKKSACNFVGLPDTGRKENVLSVTHTYRLEEQQTGGRLACIDLVVAPGHGIPPHTHRIEDETFYVVEGSVEIVGDDLASPTTVQQGGLFYGPRGKMHGFRNGGPVPARLLVFMIPGANMQHMFAALAELTAKFGGMPAKEDVAALCAKFDIVFAPAGEWQD